jgi:hypothetical protein
MWRCSGWDIVWRRLRVVYGASRKGVPALLEFITCKETSISRYLPQA